MTEYIDRQKLIDDFTGSGGLTVYGKYVPAIVSRINSQPAADVVEVVRCKDCVYWGGVDEFGDGFCKKPSGIDDIARENDFCSYGERREENDI